MLDASWEWMLGEVGWCWGYQKFLDRLAIELFVSVFHLVTNPQVIWLEIIHRQNWSH